MENMHKYVVAGHAFAVALPDGYTKEEHLAAYEPFSVLTILFSRSSPFVSPSLTIFARHSLAR